MYHSDSCHDSYDIGSIFDEYHPECSNSSNENVVGKFDISKKISKCNNENHQSPSNVIQNLHLPCKSTLPECESLPSSSKPLCDSHHSLIRSNNFHHEAEAIIEEHKKKLNLAFVPKLSSKSSSFNVTQEDVKTLYDENWLNGVIISFYMFLIMERSQIKEGFLKVYSTETLFFTNLETKGYLNVKNWTQKVDIFSYDLMLVPVYLKDHWCMSIINFNECTIKYYDSLGGENMTCCKMLLKYLENEKLDKKKEAFNSSKWTLKCVKNIPRQTNTSDCGVFACMFAEYISRNAPFLFSQEDMPYFRKKMVFEIIEGRLMK